ncbi:MAG: leucyl aminopeptidase [Bacteroidetes bacterium]|nr:MAG: leucyl aminopeptidase [Bacteroidota bacterium]
MTITISTTSKIPETNLVIPVSGNGASQNSLKSITDTFGIPTHQLDRDFKGESGEVFPFYSEERKIYLLGLGPEPDFAKTLQAFRSFTHNSKQKLGTKLAVSFLHQNLNPGQEFFIEAAINGILLGTYQIGRFKTEPEEAHPLNPANDNANIAICVEDSLVESAEKLVQKGKAVAETQMQMLNLVNAPANKKIPTHLAGWAENSGKTHGYQVTNHTKKEIEAKNLHALLAVNRGSENPPAFIVMEYKPRSGEAKHKIGLVGKGITFDTGGLSLKPSTNMHYMKSDMGGAAAVLGTMEVAAKLQLPVHLIGIVPSSENSVDALSIKPGDVIDSYSGKTIEIIDTDAEGRLILADGLAYMIKNYDPEILINLATLTGSAVRTFGFHAGALFSNDDNLASQISKAGNETGERVWQLPMWDCYKDDISSDVADVRNYSGLPIAGAIGAAKFLEAFIGDHAHWAHMDIAGVAFGSNEFSQQKSATAFGIRLLLQYIENLIESKT